MSAMLSIDQGTTNTKAVLVSETGKVLANGSAPVRLSLPAAGWVEQDAEDIWCSVLRAVDMCVRNATTQGGTVRIAGVTVSAQRESVVAWRRDDGLPAGPVIGWQDQRTAAWCESLSSAEAQKFVCERTGLRIDAMFSAPKIRWLLDHHQRAADMCVGTVDAWLVWRLTGGGVHACDAGNASRTLLYDVVDLRWSPELLELFQVPAGVLPEVRPSNGQYGSTRGLSSVADGTPVLAVLADSHAALYGHGCTQPGMAKATYGTGSSVMTPTARFAAGETAVPTTLAWVTDRPTYAREGNILSSGATLAWTAKLLRLAGGVAELVRLAAEAPNSGGVVLVPAFTGLGAPYWDRQAKASLVGLSQATTPAEVARAAVDSVAQQVCDVVEEIERTGPALTQFRADGGATVSELLMQSQADLLGHVVQVAELAEVSALGAARLGWSSLGATDLWTAEGGQGRRYQPAAAGQEVRESRKAWRDAVRRSRGDALAG